MPDDLNSMNDATLIEQFRNGNSDAFNLLVNRWHKPIYRFAYRYYGNPTEADDITQKTFIKAYQKLDLLNDAEKFSSWIYRIATHICIDQARINDRRKTSPLETWIESSELATTLTPDVTLEKSELGSLMQKARSLFMDYLYGELDNEQHIEMETFLDNHPHLLEELNELRETRSMIQNIPLEDSVHSDKRNSE